jgi:hypothetical protein
MRPAIVDTGLFDPLDDPAVVLFPARKMRPRLLKQTHATDSKLRNKAIAGNWRRVKVTGSEGLVGPRTAMTLGNGPLEMMSDIL